eukprot:m.433009 g.433009  ORF g.433009 m.433009 type:complete len:62 (+) comp17516_c0_seq1:6020-6205(+)
MNVNAPNDLQSPSLHPQGVPQSFIPLNEAQPFGAGAAQAVPSNANVKVDMSSDVCHTEYWN